MTALEVPAGYALIATAQHAGRRICLWADYADADKLVVDLTPQTTPRPSVLYGINYLNLDRMLRDGVVVMTRSQTA